MTHNLNISVVIPVMNEAENIASLVAEIEAVSAHVPITQIVLVNDGSTDNTAGIVRGLQQKNPAIHLVTHTVRSGQSAALRTGIRAAQNSVVVTMDGDGQNDPADIVQLYEALRTTPNAPMLLVAGQRAKRQDSLLKKFTSRTGNGIRRALLKDGVRDTGCSLKMFRRDDYLSLPYFNHMHRFLPALFAREYGTILLRDVGHRHRTRGVSKYGFWDRLWAGIFDLTGVLWLQARAAAKTDIIVG